MGRGWISETLLITTRRSAPATSIPWRKPARMAARRPKRKSATTKEPTVSTVRTFFRLRLARNRGRNLVIHRPPLLSSTTLGGGNAATETGSALHQHALLEMEQGLGPLRRPGVVGDHEDRGPALRHQQREQLQDLVGALAVQVAGGLVAEQEGGIGRDGAGDGHPLLLPARELAREVVHAVGEAHHPERGLYVLPPLRL